MQSKLLISGGRILDPGQGIDIVGDILIDKGNIISIGNRNIPVDRKGPSIIDATGLIVCPGFIDLHCHLREPGFEDKETIASGTRAAAKGGFATICCMPNTIPPLDTTASVDYVKKKSQAEGVIRVLPIGCITKGRQGKELCEMYELAEMGVVGFSDDGDTVTNPRIMTLAMEYSLITGLPIIDHCEDKELCSDGAMNEGWVSTRLGLPGIPAAAEEIIISRDIALANLTGAKLHVAHVSTSGSVDIIRKAKEDGISITAEVTPNHLILTEERVMGNPNDNKGRIDYDTNAKVNPPLRTRKDTEALLEGLKDNVIDIIATDHAPHTVVDKSCEFGFAAFGISSFETALGCLMGLVHSKQLELNTLISKLTTEPARIIGNRFGELGTLKTGCRADITLIDPNMEWIVDTKSFTSKGKNSPFNGYKFKGKTIATIFTGDIIYKDSSVQFEQIND